MDFVVHTLDPAILFWLQATVVNPAFTPVMKGLSAAAQGGALWIVLGVALCVTKKYRPAGAAVLLSLLLMIVLGDGLLKHAVMRLRPCLDYPWVPLAVPVPSGYSFPSGHSFCSFAAATALFRYHRRWGIGALVLAAAIAFSRLYLFVHYPSDVAAGAIFGVATGLGAYYLVEALRSWKHNPAWEFIYSKKENK